MIRPDEIIRSERKTLAVSVDALGRVTVRAPKSCADERIFSFLREKEAWILRCKAKSESVGIRLPEDDLDGYGFLLLGKTCKITLTKEQRVRYDGENLFLPEKNAKQRLTQWLKENASRIFSLATERKAAQMGVRYASVHVSSARGRWGSCSAKNEIRYSFRLLYAPKEVIEYVVTHELAHVLHKNHSKAFWAAVETYEPDYKRKRKWLKDRAALMRIF